jgi:hypothetical protein
VLLNSSCRLPWINTAGDSCSGRLHPYNAALVPWYSDKQFGAKAREDIHSQRTAVTLAVGLTIMSCRIHDAKTASHLDNVPCCFSKATVMQEYPQEYPCSHRHRLPPVAATSSNRGPSLLSERGRRLAEEQCTCRTGLGCSCSYRCGFTLGGSRVGWAREDRYTNRMSEAMANRASMGRLRHVREG